MQKVRLEVELTRIGREKRLISQEEQVLNPLPGGDGPPANGILHLLAWWEPKRECETSVLGVVVDLNVVTRERWEE